MPNKNPMYVDDIEVSGTMTVNGSPIIAGAVILGAGENLTGSSTSNIAFNTNKFTVAGASGNTVIGGTLGVVGNVAVNTDKFTVAASTGNTVVAGTLGVTGAVTNSSTTLCSDDVTIASAKKIIGAGTGANGIVLKNLKNAAATALSGTQKDIEIDIGGTPYYFTVYPTKA